MQACRQVRRLADHRLLLRRAFADEFAHHHQTRGNAHSRAQRLFRWRRQLGNRGGNGEPGPHRPLGLVLVRPRPAEIGQHPVAHVLRHMAIHTRDLLGHRVLVRPDHLPHLFRVQLT